MDKDEKKLLITVIVPGTFTILLIDYSQSFKSIIEPINKSHPTTLFVADWERFIPVIPRAYSRSR